MKGRLAAVLVRGRYFTLALVVLLACFSYPAIGRTVIEYDLTHYLRDDTPTKKGLAMMSGSFDATAGISVMFKNPAAASEEFCRKAAERPGVIRVDQGSDVTRDGNVYRLVSILCDENEAAALDAWLDPALEGIDATVSGGARSVRSIREALSREMPLIMLVSCLFVLAVLLVMNRNPLDCVLFFAVIGISILVNMGTNWVFESVSFITFAVAAILQLALAMDYSIMMLNAFKRHMTAENDKVRAAALAVEDTLMPLTSSALTTVAGMLSLLFMSFTIGFDIGMVLAKGILISLLTVFMCMPALLTLFSGHIHQPHARPVPEIGRRVAGLAVKDRGITAGVLIVVIVLGFVAHQNTVYSYTVTGADPAAESIAEIFGAEEPLVILYPTARGDEDYDRNRAMMEEIMAVRLPDREAVTSVLSMVTTLSPALEYIDTGDLADMAGVSPMMAALGASALHLELPMRADVLVETVSDLWDPSGLSTLLGEEKGDEIKALAASIREGRALLEGAQWSRAILTMNVSYSDSGAPEVLGKIREILARYEGDNWGMTGSLAASDDIAGSFSGDVWHVSLITLAAVFLIIAVSFRSVWIPLILVCVIQGAIWINIGFSSLAEGSVFFMCYLICMALQMGATIDYAILLTDHYIGLRRILAPGEAAKAALERSMRTILTSGLSFVTAGFAVGRVSSVFYISSIGTMLGRGAFVSLVLVIFLLPRLLIWTDKMVTGRRRGADA